jgi:4-diphosphocytidyl-2-C-methyl-D-erythritol kinase
MEAAASVFGAGVNPNQVLPLSENIIIRAVSLFNERTGFNMGLKIRLEKRMPVGGGLGGGSSDAASTLLALNFLATEASIPGIRPLNATAIGELGALLGSDVPFFLKKCGAARVSGRGERIKPLTIPSNLWIVLVKPDFSSDTAEAYRLLDQFRMAQGALYGLNDEKPVQVMPNAGAALALHPGEWPFINDFLPVFLAHDAVNTAYRRIFEQLQALGADFYSLSGAGSTCFGVFADKEKAYTAYENLRLQWNFVQCTFSLAI